ncbi:hypothetical protein H4R33_006256 [Dimargaris cristalligena]|nr:hypothetical protein H4R33_006256 [Dimargaris cristalligena]
MNTSVHSRTYPRSPVSPNYFGSAPLVQGKTAAPAAGGSLSVVPRKVFRYVRSKVSGSTGSTGRAYNTSDSMARNLFTYRSSSTSSSSTSGSFSARQGPLTSPPAAATTTHHGGASPYYIAGATYASEPSLLSGPNGSTYADSHYQTTPPSPLSSILTDGQTDGYHRPGTAMSLSSSQMSQDSQTLLSPTHPSYADHSNYGHQLPSFSQLSRSHQLPTAPLLLQPPSPTVVRARSSSMYTPKVDDDYLTNPFKSAIYLRQGSGCLLGLPGYTVDFELAAQLLHLSQKLLNVEATALLGFCYEFGLGVTVDYQEAERLYNRAADAGNGLAQARMAFFRKFGRPGIKMDRLEAERWQRTLNHQGPNGIQWIRQAAGEFQLAAAEYCLGLCYMEGQGVVKNDQRAFHWFQKAALQHLDRAQSVLGYCYVEGCGVAKDPAQALHWYRLAADQGESMAIYNLGYCYEYGVGVKRDVHQAYKWYRRAAEQGNALAQNSLGYCYEDGIGLARNPTEAAKWYRRSAEQGYPWAQCNLGYCYQYGIGVTKSFEKGALWYRRSAEQGYSRAQHNVGFCYQNGIGVERSGQLAFHWYRQSAQQGNVFAYHSLGYCYQYGTGVEINLPRAVEWYTKAACQGHAPAQLSLGYCYRNGIGVARINLPIAYDWFRQAAEQGNHLAQNSLGYCFEEGLGVTADPAAAFKWYSAAAAQGNAWAQCNVAQCYLQGIGTPNTGGEPDPVRAVEWFQRAAEQNLARAQQKLGFCYQLGIGMAEPQPERAVHYYTLAAQQNNPAALLHLATCYEQGIGVAVDLGQAIHWLQRGSTLGDLTANERFRELIVRCSLRQTKARAAFGGQVSPIARCA